MEKSRHIKAKKSQRLWVKTLSFCLFFAFAFSLVNHAVPNHIHWEIKNSESDQIFSSSNDIQASYQMPVDNEDIHLFLEEITKSEEDNEIDSFEFGYHNNETDPSVPHTLLNKKLSALPQIFSLCRSTIPLFILYHSWKSFQC